MARPPKPEQLTPRPLRLALTLDESAQALGMSRDHFDAHVRPELRVVRQGRKVVVPISELQRWLDRNAAFVIEEAA
jgi:hypothetical protein